MKPQDPLRDLDELLRVPVPRAVPPPGLESKILRALRENRRPARTRWWPWLALPPALAAAAFLWKPPQPAQIAAAPPAASPLLFPNAISTADPLQSESFALAQDARRAGDFLVGCLPSLENAR
jgi:hypothetical protein